ncbi:DUF1653 domain-containing protein [Oceanobacillus timonensis]|uniref:DUF1653 domain-containing protein n=1 Tax=Oceanobacillus timonensis TaxID=1926285 RepID=UPI0009BBB6A4|nr:DUF1653 domain-containing protein [Oceanobacillus timonensis]
MKKYRHFKGREYEVLLEAIHTENNERMIVYKDMEGNVYVRPASMFFEKVEHNGKIVNRFEPIDS